MKKLFLMVAFAGFAMAASAQTEPTAATTQTADKKDCPKVNGCCASKATASTTAPAATASVKSTSKSAACSETPSAGCCASKKSSTAMAAKADKKAATQK
jgi:hypothetical protein